MEEYIEAPPSGDDAVIELPRQPENSTYTTFSLPLLTALLRDCQDMSSRSSSGKTGRPRGRRAGARKSDVPGHPHGMSEAVVELIQHSPGHVWQA